MRVDPDLIRRVRDGDVSAFDQLFNSYQKRVYNLIYRMVGNEQDAAGGNALSHKELSHLWRSI